MNNETHRDTFTHTFCNRSKGGFFYLIHKVVDIYRFIDVVHGIFTDATLCNFLSV